MARSIDDILREAFETHGRLDFPAAPPISAPARSRSARRWVMPGIAAAAAVSVIIVTVMATGNGDARPTPIAPMLLSTTSSAPPTSPSSATARTSTNGTTTTPTSVPARTTTAGTTTTPPSSAQTAARTDPGTEDPTVVPPLTELPAAYLDNLPRAQRDADIQRALAEIGANEEVGLWFRVESHPKVDTDDRIVETFTVGGVPAQAESGPMGTSITFDCGDARWMATGRKVDPDLGLAQLDPDLPGTSALVAELLALMDCSQPWPFAAQHWDRLAETPQDWVAHQDLPIVSAPSNLSLVLPIQDRVKRLGLTEFGIDHPQGEVNGYGPWGADQISIAVYEIAKFSPKVRKVHTYLVQGMPLWETARGAAHFECGGRNYTIESNTSEQVAKATGARMKSQFDTALLFSQLMLMDLPCAADADR
ncbi:hypothetical protein D1871_07715 [Nakamurella silvestris]|nr:hypothetical protein D1871_07715 [Nakamurella silvestris]